MSGVNNNINKYVGATLFSFFDFLNYELHIHADILIFIHSKLQLKLAIARIKLLRSKRGALVNQLRSDIAHLLDLGHNQTAVLQVLPPFILIFPSAILDLSTVSCIGRTVVKSQWWRKNPFCVFQVTLGFVCFRSKMSSRKKRLWQHTISFVFSASISFRTCTSSYLRGKFLTISWILKPCTEFICFCNIPRNCSTDLKDAIASIIFASGKCRDIPELQNVCKCFEAKYGRKFVTSASELHPNCGVYLTVSSSV